MAVVAAMQGEIPAVTAENAFSMLCYLPAHEGMSAHDIECLAVAVREFD